MSDDLEQQFAMFIRDQGLVLDGLPIMDGKKHRLDSEGGRKGNRAGEYKGFIDGRPNGWVINYRSSSEIIKWRPEDYEPIPIEERAAFLARIEAESARRASEAAASFEHKARRVQQRWDLLPTQPAADDATYLHRKQVRALGVKFRHNKVVVPVRDIDGKLWSLQTISPEPNTLKLFTKGTRKAGNMHVISAIEPGKPILVAEGYATACSVHMATNQPVVVAFDSGNYDAVVGKLRERHPESPILILADDDRNRTDGVNVGLTSARNAAKKYGGYAIAPVFKDKASSFTDFNDLHVQEGLDAVRTQVETVLFEVERMPIATPAPQPVSQLDTAIPNPTNTDPAIQNRAQDITETIPAQLSAQITIIDKLRNIPLESVFEGFGAKRDPVNPNHHWITHAGRFATMGRVFFNNDSGKGGNGAIDLSMHLGEMSLIEAVNWMQVNIYPSVSKTRSSPLDRPVAIAQNKERVVSPIPEPVVSRLPQVRMYLTEVIQIPSAIVNQAIDHKRVQADKFGNAMFTLCDLHGNKVGVELRGTGTKPFHSVRGKKGLFFAGSPQSKIAVFVESSIEALSYLALRDPALVIGTAGSTRERLDEAAKTLHALGFKIVDGFNPDRSGELQGKALASYIPNVDRHRPTRGNDWNHELKIRGLRAIEIVRPLAVEVDRER